MSSLPEEMYLQILVRVTVKSTCVCKCVCRSWFEIISNPSFVKTHLDFNTQRKNYNLIFEDYDVRTTCWTVNSISYDSLLSMDGSESDIVELADYPFSSDGYGTRRFLGSCNGLVCMYCKGSGSTRAHEKSILFFNPTTKEYKVMINESVLSYHCLYITAFGYDCKANDYKLIILDDHVESTELLIYTLGSNTWKTCQQHVPYAFRKMRQTGTLFNGVFHWLGKARKKNSSNLIVVFDLSDQKFNELPLPEVKHLRMTIGVLEGCLCVAVMVSEVCFQVWVMQDYGAQESWTPRYTFGYRMLGF